MRSLADQLRGQVHPDDEHLVRTALLCLEVTHNRGGGSIPTLESVREICDWAHESGLKTHLDGARLFNAVVASGISASDWAAGFDTVSVCFSKGLGAPVGSALVGTREAMRVAHRHRKLFGGGMRQAGIIAAGAIYALDHQIERLSEDHAHAKLLADAVRSAPNLTLDPSEAPTNIVIFRAPAGVSSEAFIAALGERVVLALPFSARHVRLVTHADVSREQAESAAEIVVAAARFFANE
jgi:threonine aldolase